MTIKLTKDFSLLIIFLIFLKENIPTEVVEMLDKAYSFGVDTSYPPRFKCQKCPGKMVPIYYIIIHGEIHEYKEK